MPKREIYSSPSFFTLSDTILIGDMGNEAKYHLAPDFDVFFDKIFLAKLSVRKIIFCEQSAIAKNVLNLPTGCETG